MLHAEHALATFCKNAREWCESPSALEACSKNPANLAPPSPWFLSAGEGAFRCFRNNCFRNKAIRSIAKNLSLRSSAPASLEPIRRLALRGYNSVLSAQAPEDEGVLLDDAGAIICAEMMQRIRQLEKALANVYLA